MPSGVKHDIVEMTKVPFSDRDYFRGLIDGNGSVGFSTTGLPFISLNTSSDYLAAGYQDFIYKVTGINKNNNRNKRDNTYNIVLGVEGAQKLIKELYYSGCLGLKRKMDSAEKVLAWVRPSGMKKRNFEVKKWTSEEDAFILSHPIEESQKHLNRTAKSVKIRLWRLTIRASTADMP